MKDPITPIIISCSQYTQRKNSNEHLDPLSLMIKTGQNAINSTAVEKIKEYIDAIYMVNINSWSYKDAPAALGDALNIIPKEKVYLPDGGNTPQMLVNRAAKKISKNKLKGILIIGAEASYSLLLAKKGKIKLDWPQRRNPDYMEGELWDGIDKFENKYKFKFPPLSYAVLENAIRNATGRSIKEHREYMGKLFQHFSEIASKNPYAWSQKAYTAEEIITPTKNNRMICFPYTKRMCSNMFVDQSAAVLMIKRALAEELGVSKNQWVYIMGGFDLKNIHEITRRPHLHTSPASREGAKLALNQAGLELNEINAFDLYSCFPSIVEIMKKEIEISENDPRDLTLTGGLTYFGGPWSNYSLHAIVTAVEKIQKNPKLKIMVVANGGYNTKQSFGIYGKNPPAIPWNTQESPKIQEDILNNFLEDPIKKANGRLTIEGYTITYNRDQQPIEGIVIGKIDEDRRTIAYIKADQDKLTELEYKELLGKNLPVYYDNELQYNIIELSD